MADRYLAEITYYNPDTAAAAKLYYANGSGFMTKQSDTPASQFYDARIAQPVNISRALFAGPSTLGPGRVGYGELVLLNGDAALDGLLNYGFDGRAIRILRSEVAAPQYSDFVEILNGTMEQLEFQVDVVRVKVRDNQFQLAIPLQPTKFSGAGLGTLEGVAGDLKGKPKPVCLGAPSNVQPPCVETAKLIYQVHDDVIATGGVISVYDQGVALTPSGSAYATQADLLDNTLAPAAGFFKYYSSATGSYFRLGSTPNGLITADLKQAAVPSFRTAAQLFKALLARVGLTPNAGDITALDALNPAVIGFWASEEITIAEVCDQIAGSVGAWWGVDKSGAFRIKQFTKPSITPVASFTKNDLLKAPQRLTVNDPNRGLPIFRSTVNYSQNYTVQTAADLAASVTAARRQFLGEQWRAATDTDATVKTLHLLADELVENSLLTVEADAQAEATRRLTLRKVRRDRLAVVPPLTNANAAIDLGDTIELVNARYGSKPVGTDPSTNILNRYVVLGIQTDAAKKELLLNLWGPSVEQVNYAEDTGVLWVSDTGAYVITSPE